MTRAVALLLAGLGVAACARSHVDSLPSVAGTSAQDPSSAGDGGRSPADVGAGGSASSMHDAEIDPTDIDPTAPDAMEPDLAPPDEPPPIDSESTMEIWIGELWSIAPLLCDPNATWQDTPTVIEPMGYVEPVVLLLDRRDDPAVPIGEIAFGQGELPQEPDVDPNASGDSGSFWLCSIQVPSKGGVYTIHNARRGDGRLSFDIVPAEIWGNRSCEGFSCYLAGEREALDLVIHDDTMEGRFGGAGFGTPGELRLQRMR